MPSTGRSGACCPGSGRTSDAGRDRAFESGSGRLHTGEQRDGTISDYAAAELGHVTRARMSPITKLLNLTPDIQEAILFLLPVESGRDPITERQVRTVLASSGWQERRKLWARVRPSMD